MREPAPDYSTGNYERPNQPWICGLANEGQSCPAGPTARGRCPAMAECTPLRDGDRWECNRSQLRGGPCDVGPMPEGQCGRVQRCHPTRSLRSVRSRFVRGCMLLAVGAAILALSADWRDRVIAPGPLAGQHAQLLERTGAKPDCAACHAAAEQNVAGWMASLAIARGDMPTQSQLCMKCHDKTISATLALAAHNMPPNALRQITDKTDTENSSDPFLIGCAACHSEHHGSRGELTAIDNAACQTCHQRRYESFAADHPDFGIWPYERRTRIVFNHASHRAKHFSDKKQAFDCRTCHLDDATGSVQMLASYEATCAGCHDEKIATSVARGVPMLVLPTLDVAALKKAGHDIGPWPAKAMGDFDGRLPPAMKLLLAADPGAAEAMAALGPDFDFQDVDPNDPVRLADCAKLAAAIKSMFGDLSRRGPLAVRERLSRTLSPIVREPESAALIAGLSPDTVRGAAGWLPGIDVRQEAWPPDAISGPLRHKEPAYGPTGEWSRDDPTLSVRYRPKAHADPVLASWLELLAATPQLESRPVAMAAFKELSKPTAPGLCVSCHSVERNAAGTLAINWRAFDRTTEPRTFTKFSHGPHLLLPQLADCTHCHSIDDAASTATSYTDLNPARFVSDFAPLSKRKCAQCHTARAAGDRCQSCHNYHVQGSGFRVQGSDSNPTLLNPEP